MAFPLLNITIFSKSTLHSLRAIQLAVFPPAFIMLLIQGICSSDVNPAIGILPLFFSSAYAALLLANEKRCGCQGSGLTGTAVHLVVDVVLGVGLLVCLILDWVLMGDYGYGNGGLVMLGTYGTCFLICNFVIHCYFVAKQLQEAMGPGASFPMSCPQCQNVPFSFGSIQLPPGLKNGYAPLLDEGEPRVSVEERRGDDGEEMV